MHIFRRIFLQKVYLLYNYNLLYNFFEHNFENAYAILTRAQHYFRGFFISFCASQPMFQFRKFSESALHPIPFIHRHTNAYLKALSSLFFFKFTSICKLIQNWMKANL